MLSRLFAGQVLCRSQIYSLSVIYESYLFASTSYKFITSLDCVMNQLMLVMLMLIRVGWTNRGSSYIWSSTGHSIGAPTKCPNSASNLRLGRWYCWSDTIGMQHNANLLELSFRMHCGPCNEFLYTTQNKLGVFVESFRDIFMTMCQEFVLRELNQLRTQFLILLNNVTTYT